jgi:hypothetical protein
MYVGFEDEDAEQYVHVTCGFDDGLTSDTDYMWTGLKSNKKCDVATGVYVAGCVKNSSGTDSGWSAYITNGGTATKKTVKHSGKATYYVAFAG